MAEAGGAQVEQQSRVTDEAQQDTTATTATHGHDAQQFSASGPLPPATTTAPSGGRAATASERAYGGAPEHGIASPHTFTGPAHLRVTTNGLNVRSTADATSKENIVGGVYFGDRLEGVEREGDWIRILFRGAHAFVHGGFVEVVEAAAHHQPQQQAAPPVVAHDHVMHADSATPVAGPPPAKTKTFTTLAGTQEELSDPNTEVPVLDEIRYSQKRFDPAWLIHVQSSVLHVADATGAMNTETLRALRRHFNDQTLGATQILDETLLAKLDTNPPFLAGPTDGFGDYKSIDHHANLPADRAAQAVGYASWKEYRALFQDATFLGKSLKLGISDGKVHPYLAARLSAAEKFLATKTGQSDPKKIRQAIGWDGEMGGAYDDKGDNPTSHVTGNPASHMHTMGLAVDVDPNSNHYLFQRGDGASADWITAFYERATRVAARVFGGDRMDASRLMTLSSKLSSEELYAHVKETSHAFSQYVDLSRKSDEEIVKVLVAHGFTEAEAKEELAPSDGTGFHTTSKMAATGAVSREFTTMNFDILVALRDAAGLAWGGTEMHVAQNGDFMHFDCRHDTFGQAVFSKEAPKGQKKA